MRNIFHADYPFMLPLKADEADILGEEVEQAWERAKETLELTKSTDQAADTAEDFLRLVSEAEQRVRILQMIKEALGR